jgi:copper chaperone NosL
MSISQRGRLIKSAMNTSMFCLRAKRVRTRLAVVEGPGHLLFARLALMLCSLVHCAGCESAELRPIDILSEDMCAFCKMAISEKRYASELMTHDGDVFKFDDIGCMLRFRKGRSHPEPAAATFVIDFDTRQWLKSEEAYFVKSKEFKTPMGGHVVAFKAAADAEDAANRTQGVSLRYAALLE